jgi:predicted amidohydrolase
MKTAITILISLILVQFAFGQELKIDFPYLKQVEYQGDIQVDFARYGICQLSYEFKDTINGLKGLKNVKQTKNKIISMTNTAVDNGVNVLIFPELILAFNKKTRDKLLEYLQNMSSEHDMIIIAGSFYNDNRENTVPVILPTGIDFSYKIKQSKFEVSPIYNEGMTRGDTLVVISSKYGKILPIVCVDLISDEVQFVARYLSNKIKINTLVNLTYNPASSEFMREMSAIVKRHRLFGLISNAANPKLHNNNNCVESSYGNSSVFASLFTHKDRTTKLVSDCFKDCDNKDLLPSYTSLISQLDPNIEGMIVIDLNLSTVRPPKRTNAPDQGYPTVKNLQIIELAD